MASKGRADAAQALEGLLFDVKVDGAGLELLELADGVELAEVAAKTEAAYTVSVGLSAA